MKQIEEQIQDDFRVLEESQEKHNESMEDSPTLREVALIAKTFHWSEHEILSMPSIQRKFYVSLITDNL